MQRVEVIGGGIAGLSAALELSAAGIPVRVREAASELGGRARTHDRSGHKLNYGAHALYKKGSAADLLKRHGLEVTGGTPSSTKLVLDTAKGLRRPGPLELAALLANFARAGRLAKHPGSVEDAVENALFKQIVRIATYCGDLGALSAKRGITQVRRTLGGVLYLDDGWAQLVQVLERAVIAQGGVIERGQPVTELGEGPTILAVPKRAAAELVPEAERLWWPKEAAPVEVTCLDLALARDTGAPSFVTSTEQPLYLSVHSRSARLSPEPGALVHVLSYVPCERAELEAFADRVLGGWREHLVHARFIQRARVSDAIQGNEERASPVAPGVYLAGEWVPSTSMLADAAVETACAATRQLRLDSEGARAA